MVKAIIFDCYGVLVTDSWLPFKRAHFGHSQEQMQEATDLNKQCDSGLIDYNDFIEGLSNLSGLPKAQVDKEIQNNTSNKELFDYIKELKKSYKIGMLSNVGCDVLGDLFSDEELALFDSTCLSYETGFVKPDPRAYQAVIDMLDVGASECVMIDDFERNCTAAEDAGMKSVFYKDFDQMKSELERLLNPED